MSFALQFVPDFAGTIAAAAGIESLPDLLGINDILFGAGRCQTGIAFNRFVYIEGRLSANARIRLPASGWCDPQNPADRPNTKDFPVTLPSRACEHALPGSG